MLKLTETFLSIQGEGINSGLLTYFIRLSDCNLRCSYCDTKYAYKDGKEKRIDDIISETKKQSKNCKQICITGGEPLIQPEVKTLINKLLKLKYKIDIETNGSVLIKDFPNNENILYSLDIKCPSSKMSKEMNLANLKYLAKKDQVKFIIKDKKDYNYANKIIKKYNLIKKTNVIFTPVDGIKADQIASWVIKDGLNIRVGLQIHKVIWGKKKGV